MLYVVDKKPTQEDARMSHEVKISHADKYHCITKKFSEKFDIFLLVHYFVLLF